MHVEVCVGVYVYDVMTDQVVSEQPSHLTSITARYLSSLLPNLNATIDM